LEAFFAFGEFFDSDFGFLEFFGLLALALKIETLSDVFCQDKVYIVFVG